MCGRYALATPPSELAELFGFAAAPLPEFPPRWNIAPVQQGLLAVADRPGAPLRLRVATWGLVPPWAKDSKSSVRSINARAETASSKPTFRDAARNGRCLVLADGFYEWSGPPKRRTPHYLFAPDARPLLFAGLLASAPGEIDEPDAGQIAGTYAILTTPARGAAEQIHDRMPVILSRAAAGRWVAGDPMEVADIQRVACEDLKVRDVSPRVGRVGNEGPELILSVDADTAASGEGEEPTLFDHG